MKTEAQYNKKVNELNAEITRLQEENRKIKKESNIYERHLIAVFADLEYVFLNGKIHQFRVINKITKDIHSRLEKFLENKSKEARNARRHS